MDSMQCKLRKAIGVVKDQTSISIAKVGSAGSPEVEIALVKATSHDESPLEEKYVQELLYLTAGSREHVDVCMTSMTKRLRKTHNWIVAIKTLMLAHRLLRDGDAAIEHELASARKKGMRVLNVYAFRDESHSNGWDFSAFVRAYGLYLDERLECSVPSFSLPKPNQCPKNDPACDQNPRHSSSSLSPSGSDEDRTRGKQRSSQRRRKPVRKMRPPELMQKFPLFQRLLERIIACRPSGAAKTNRLVLFALHPIVRESFLVYSDIRDGMAILLDAFFDLEQLDCIAAFDIYSKAAKQLDELIAFHSFCKSLGVCKVTEYPAIEKISDEMLETMSASLRLRLDSVRDNNKKSKGQQARSVSFRDDVEGDSGHSRKGIRSSQYPPYSSRSPIPPGTTANPPLPSNPVRTIKQEFSSAAANDGEGHSILLDLDEKPSMSTQELEDKLALALFPGTEARINTTWESFSSDTAENGSTVPRNFMETSKQVTGWELALLDSESNLSRSTSDTLAGGFDRLLLDNLYDQAVENRRREAAASGPAGSASSMAKSVHFQSSILALSAPPAAGSTNQALEVQEDPFAASAKVAPPPYVQMSDLRKKQQHLLQEQQQWLQYQQQGSNFGYGVPPINFASNPFVTPFQSPAYPVSYFGVHPHYA